MKTVGSFKAFIALLISLCVLFSLFSACAGNSPVEGYVPTEELTQKDFTDPYQKNYQKDPETDEVSYLYKSAEWISKEAGTARVTLTMGTDADLETTVVYVFTDCTVHGFSKSLAISNINYLLSYYDHVDVVIVDGGSVGGIKMFFDVKDTNCLNRVTFDSNRHYNTLAYVGLYDYLMGVAPGKETGLEKQQRFPDAIYTSFDSRLVTLSGNGAIEFDKLKSLDIGSALKEYDAMGRYFSMCGCGGGDTKQISVYNSYKADWTVNITPERRLRANILALMMDPQTWTDMTTATEKLWDGNTQLKLTTTQVCRGSILFTYNADYHVINGSTPLEADYLYSQSFGSVDMPIVFKLVVSDIIDEAFCITKVTSSDPKAVISTTDNRIDVGLVGYDPSAPFVITADIQLKDLESRDDYDRWMDTNAGEATVNVFVNGEMTIIMESDSPKLARTAKKPPVTGDGSRLLTQAALLAVSGGTLLLAVTRKKKKRTGLQ